jgi:flagellar motor switch protein FliG
MSELAPVEDTSGGPSTPDGVTRAAIVLLLLGEQEASEILRHMDPDSVHKLVDSMSALSQLSNDEIVSVAARFCEDAGKESLLAGDDEAEVHIRNLLVLALGPDKARDVISGVRKLDRRATGVDALSRRQPYVIADWLREEHPQVSATLLSQLEPEQAGKVLALFEEEAQHSILLRMAQLDTVPLSAIEELNGLVEDHLRASDDEANAARGGGPATVASVLNALDGATQAAILQSVKDHDLELGEQVELNMFTFDDLMKVDDRAVQTLLAEIPGQSLATALKGCEDTTKQKFFSNMSKRAADMLADDLEVSGPVKLSEVEAAQREIVSTAKRLIDAGTIVVGGMGGGDDLVY